MNDKSPFDEIYIEAFKLQKERDEARYWARRMYQHALKAGKKKSELRARMNDAIRWGQSLQAKLDDEITVCDKFHIERDVYHYHLDIAREALKKITLRYPFNDSQDIAHDALAKINS